MKTFDGTIVKSIIKSVEKIDESKPKCIHTVSAKVWKPLKTLKVKRNGSGLAIKTIKEECKLCGITRIRDVTFTDTRIIRSL